MVYFYKDCSAICTFTQKYVIDKFPITNFSYKIEFLIHDRTIYHLFNKPPAYRVQIFLSC